MRSGKMIDRKNKRFTLFEVINIMGKAKKEFREENTVSEFSINEMLEMQRKL